MRDAGGRARNGERTGRVSEVPREPPVYRPFAVLAFGATLLGGTPLGLWMLGWLYLGAPAVTLDWRLLHAHLQVFGFFATLIPGVAQHLLPRFTGRRVAPSAAMPWVAALLGTALALRLAGATWEWHVAALSAPLLQGAAFLAFAGCVWRALDPPPLAFLRRHLTVSSAWLALACLVEAAARAQALGAGVPLPDHGVMGTVHAMGLFGGVLGWILGVLLRAGPMFIPDWRVPGPLARAVPWALALAVGVTALGELGAWSARASIALARFGDCVALGLVAVVAVSAGALGRGGKALPMLSRSRDEARIVRLAVVCASLAAVGSAAAVALALAGTPIHLLTDALRHLTTVGFMTAVVVAMAFRLIPVLETRLPWPRLRAVAFWALLGSVVLRTGQVVVGHGLPALAPLVALSGVLAWIAIACVGANLVRAVGR